MQSLLFDFEVTVTVPCLKVVPWGFDEEGVTCSVRMNLLLSCFIINVIPFFQTGVFRRKRGTSSKVSRYDSHQETDTTTCSGILGRFPSLHRRELKDTFRGNQFLPLL